MLEYANNHQENRLLAFSSYQAHSAKMNLLTLSFVEQLKTDYKKRVEPLRAVYATRRTRPPPHPTTVIIKR